ncbi:MAG TPA: RsiV family protein [Blastocatellia bacterium]
MRSNIALIALCLALALAPLARRAPAGTRWLAGAESTTWMLRDDTDGGPIVTKETKESTSTYTINARYPQLPEDRGSKFNIEAGNLISKRIGAFKQRVAGRGSAASRAGLTIDYHVTFSNGRLLSVAFPVESNLGHSIRETMCLTYDLVAGKGLSMADIFRPDADYLRVMAEYCIPRLTSRLDGKSDAAMVKQGASATADNYKIWNLTQSGIEITFDPNQVAPASAGVQKLIVPYTLLRQLVAPGSPVHALT